MKMILRKILNFYVTVWLIYYNFLAICTGYNLNENKNNHDISTCCLQAAGSCKSTCENISLVEIASEAQLKDSKVQEIRRYCPTTHSEFWQCINKTFYAVQKGSEWSGRTCCASASTLRCQNACATASTRQELKFECRQSDEQTLFNCLTRQEDGDFCCSNARTSECLQACKDIFKTRLTPSKELREEVQRSCSDNNPKILECIKSYTDVTYNTNLISYLPCCEQSNNNECRKTCRDVLTKNENTQEETIDILENGGCGILVPHEPMWQCFLSAGKNVAAQKSLIETSRINQIGMDSAKFHCCQKAQSSKCLRLCEATYSNDWTDKLNDFNSDCLSQMQEHILKQCIDEVDEPCELGCEGLSFCSNFNNRATELFRSCNSMADNAARNDTETWLRQGYLGFPGLNFTIRDESQCPPDLWKTIACTLQIKPCTRMLHSNQICREDCYDIMSKCIDWTKMSGTYTVASLCHKLSPSEAEAPCISLKPFREPSDAPHRNTDLAITSPCKGSPCNQSQVCLVNRELGQGYKCVTGCPMGEASSYMVPEGTYVRIPHSPNQKGSLKVCRCEPNGRIESCQPTPSINFGSCDFYNSKFKHLSSFQVECNTCSCYAGEITCTKRQCRIPGISSDRSFTSLPCNCPAHYVPVCGRNGNTYPSACIAKCVGLQDGDIEFGPCKARDPCEDNDCGEGNTCLDDRNVCLTGMQKPCYQYKCLNKTNCASVTSVRDIEMNFYPTMCELQKAGSRFLYQEKYHKYCSQSVKRGLVCGINGVTYRGECEAWSDYSTIDYYGPCQEVGIISDTIHVKCSSLKCPKIVQSCNLVIPPGACCPICGTALRIIYSRKQIDRALYALNGKPTTVLTLKSILRSLEELLQSAECRLSGYLTFENDIFVILQNLSRQPNYLQMELCTREAEKLVTLIRTQSHRITSELNLSALTVANLVKLNLSGNSGAIDTHPLVISAAILGLVIFNLNIKKR